MADVTTIEQTVFIPASPKDVYEAFLNPKIHGEMTGGAATGEGKEGASYTAWDGYITGKYLELEPNEKIVSEWQTSQWPDGYAPSRLEFRFEPQDDGTALTMIHSNVPAEQANDYDKGWHESYWVPMTEYFEHKEGK